MMLWNLGPYELLVLFAIWLIVVVGVPSAIGVYIWRRRFKKAPPKE